MPQTDEPIDPGDFGVTARIGSRAVSATARLLILVVVLAIMAVMLFQSLRIYFAQAAEIASFRAENAAKRTQISELQDQLARWQDPKFVEAEARERLGWVMPGEIGYRVIGLDGKPIGGENNVLGHDVEAARGAWFERLWGSVAVADRPVAQASTEATPSEGATVEPIPSPSASRTE